ncbi:MAG TPA: hypothetical protein VM577_16370 [Anaerovoracaceae bacterium]|nr:hypothetical protein [Anaerovoracaceae bacterium]
MNIKGILKTWGINITDDNIGIAEYLYESRKQNCFYIDKLPLTVAKDNANKFDQVDIFYQEVLDGKANKEDFLLTEMRYRNVLTKLWLYNGLFVEICFQPMTQKKANRILDSKYKKYYKMFYTTQTDTSMIEVIEKEKLAFIVQLGR